MDIKYLLPFIEAAHEVLKADAKIQMKRGDLSLDKNPYRTNDLTVILSLVGDVEGIVFYGMSSATALSIASAILGEPLKELDSLAQSGIAELGNVITGRASIKLSQSGFQTNISPPTLVLGEGAVISTLDFPRIVVPLLSESGNVEIHLALREGAHTGVSTPQLKIPQAPPKPVQGSGG